MVVAQIRFRPGIGEYGDTIDQRLCANGKRIEKILRTTLSLNFGEHMVISFAPLASHDICEVQIFVDIVVFPQSGTYRNACTHVHEIRNRVSEIGDFKGFTIDVLLHLQEGYSSSYVPTVQ